MRARAPYIALLMVSAVLAGCPSQYRQQADGMAYDTIKRAQQQSLGHTEPFTIETPADALRRRLLLDQKLPVAAPASLGTDKLAPIAHWPEKDYPRQVSTSAPSTMPAGPVVLNLSQALQVAARNNHDYQTNKETLFRVALALDLEANAFRNLLTAGTSSDASVDLGGDKAVAGVVNSGSATWQRKLANGTALTAGFAVDLANLLTADRASSTGLLGDATMSVPLLRGSGSWIVQEPLTQAERNVVYSLFTFERFKQTLAVSVATSYLGVLQQLDAVRNAEENYKSLIIATRRARRLSDAGRLPQIQVDQALQQELTARDGWISAQQSYIRRLDNLKIVLGLPTDALIELDRKELDRLAVDAADIQGYPGTRPTSQPAASPDKEAAAQLASHLAAESTTQPAGAATRPAIAPADEPVVLVADQGNRGPLEMDQRIAVGIAFENRLDLRIAVGNVYDAQRKVVVAADGLQADVTVVGSGSFGARRNSVGSASSANAQLRPEKGLYALGLNIDLPIERTAERNGYRNSLIALEQSARNMQDLEDQVKFQVRDDLRNLLEAREGFEIQAQAVTVAKRRVDSTRLFLEAGRAAIRDVLDAQESLLEAQNALTAALVNYRVAELGLQRDMGVLQVDEKGNWHEYKP